eukprot:4056061-Pyramimonas_sp.AAC.1
MGGEGAPIHGRQALPLKPGGILKPKLGARSAIALGSRTAGENAAMAPDRKNRGGPPAHASPRTRGSVTRRTCGSQKNDAVGAVADRGASGVARGPTRPNATDAA